MKKKFMFFAALAFVVSMSSCSQDFNCTCQEDDLNGGTETVVYPITGRKSDAETACTVFGSNCVLEKR